MKKHFTKGAFYRPDFASAVIISVMGWPTAPVFCLATTVSSYKKRNTTHALVSCIQPGLAICFTLDNIYVSSAQGWYTGMTQRDGMGREVREGFRMGNTGKSMADSCQCMAKTTTIL